MGVIAYIEVSGTAVQSANVPTSLVSITKPYYLQDQTNAKVDSEHSINFSQVPSFYPPSARICFVGSVYNNTTLHFKTATRPCRSTRQRELARLVSAASMPGSHMLCPRMFRFTRAHIVLYGIHFKPQLHC